MFNKKKIFLTFILISFFISFAYFILESKTENELNIYSGRKLYLIEPLINEFEKNKKIKVNIITGKSDEFIERLKLEGNNTKADILLTTDVARLSRAKKNNLLSQKGNINYWINSKAYNIVETVQMAILASIVDRIIGKSEYSSNL